MTNPPDRAIKWTLNGDPDCRYDHWVGETPVGRILITWKGWKDDHVATLDAFPWAAGGDPFFWVGTPDEVKAACEAELMRRVWLMAAPIAAEVERLRDEAESQHQAMIAIAVERDDALAEVERLRTTIYHVAAIAHCGGWVGLSEDQAIAYVRALTFGDVPGDTLDSSAAALTEAIAAARAAQEGKT